MKLVIHKIISPPATPEEEVAHANGFQQWCAVCPNGDLLPVWALDIEGAKRFLRLTHPGCTFGDEATP